MANISEVIQKIMADPKIAASSNFAGKIYRDEPILFAAPQLEKYTPPKIREMRRLARGDMYSAKVFYQQARFMESFEDNYEYKGEFAQYFPTYQHMSDAQLRGYFSWRAKVRNGAVAKTSLSFAFVYIYELLNGIGVDTPTDGFHALNNFWSAYREHDDRISAYVELWLKDYVIYHNLDRSLLEGLPDIAFDNAVMVLLDYHAQSVDAVFSALNAISSYNLEQSRFFKQHQDDVKQVVHRAFAAVSEYYNRNPRKSAREKLFGRICTGSYIMFRAALFHEQLIQKNRVYEVGNCHKYICRNGEWQCERFVWYGHNNRRIGGLLKSVDYLMRQEYGFKSTLQPGKINKILKGKIEKVIAAFQKDKQDNAPPVIDIDVSKLHQIRTAAMATQSRLLIGEELDQTRPEPAGSVPEAAPVLPIGLNEAEHEFINRLLRGEQYDDLLRSRGLMLSVLIDSINEKLFDRFNDTVIVDGNGPIVLDDYQEELKGILAG